MFTSPAELILIHFFFARNILLNKHPDLGQVIFPEGTTKEEWVTDYLIWAVYNNVLHCFGDPEPRALCLVRKLKLSKIDYYSSSYIETIFEQDADGDVSYVDYAYAPGNYPFIIHFLKCLGTPFIGWTHASTGRLHIKPRNEMPSISVAGKNGSLSKFIH